MNLFSKYIAYIKDNPEGYWFKRKLYGWGWTPVTKEGWFVTIGIAAFVIGVAWRFENGNFSESEALWQAIVPIVAAILLLVVICYKKGESPRWQWGVPEERGGVDK